MSVSGARRSTIAVALDVMVFAVGLVIALAAVTKWLAQASSPGIAGVTAVCLVVVMSRFPLVLTHRSGDVVIGFETCSLVFLVLTISPLEALALWSIGMAVAHGSSRKSWRSRLFNVGLTIQGGSLVVLTVAILSPGPGQETAELAAALLGCALYFLFDLLMTASSLAIEDGTSISSALRWRSVPLGLACFVSVDTLGYLAALLQRSQPGWTLLLLLVPVGTILVAVRSVSQAKLAQGRLSGLLEAAIQAPDWTDDVQIENNLRTQAERTLRHSVATLRATPAQSREISASIVVEGQPLRHLVVRRHGDGQRFDADDQAALDALAAVGASAFSRRRLAQEMTYLARHDTLTGLHNRAVFADRLAHSLGSRRTSGRAAVLYCDLDGFKEVNDLLGHESGDHLLVSVADRILACLRPEDTAARLGGDEFGILLDGVTDEGQAQEIAQRVLQALTPPFFVGGQPVRVQASIGVACSGVEPVTAEVLLHSADTAMYAAKALGKGRVELFAPAMRASDLDRLELEAALREAVLADEIGVHYQPVVNLHTGSIDGFEALARWTHPLLGAVPPDVFIPTAERIRIIRTLGLQILRKAHRGALQLSEQAGRPLRLAVNVSATQLTDPEFADQVEAFMRDSPQVPLVLELTEGTMLGHDTTTVEALHRLKACGALLAVDDFGTGYSSIGYLHRLPLDILKIDKVFVQNLHDQRSVALVEGVVAMARAMHLTVVTEGVEDWECARTVRALGCDLAQGYLFSRPVDLPTAMLIAGERVGLSPINAEQGSEAPRELAETPTR